MLYPHRSARASAEMIAANRMGQPGLWRFGIAACNNMGRPPGPQEKTNYIDNKLAKICEVANVPGIVFRGRVTKDLIEPENRAMFASLRTTII